MRTQESEIYVFASQILDNAKDLKTISAVNYSETSQNIRGSDLRTDDNKTQSVSPI